MDKRHLHHLWTKFRWLKPWYFLALALISAAVCVLAMRANNLHMLQLRDAVYQADKQGTDIQKPLQDLQAYVTRHMNTNLSTGTSVYPPIQLQHTYDRLVKAQSNKFAAANQSLYNDAQKHCEALNSRDFSGRNRVPCIEDYIRTHSPQQLPVVPDALYKFAFVSPRWSPDLAGWSLIVAIFSALAFVFSFIAARWFKRNLA